MLDGVLQLGERPLQLGRHLVALHEGGGADVAGHPVRAEQQRRHRQLFEARPHLLHDAGERQLVGDLLRARPVLAGDGVMQLGDDGRSELVELRLHRPRHGALYSDESLWLDLHCRLLIRGVEIVVELEVALVAVRLLLGERAFLGRH